VPQGSILEPMLYIADFPIALGSTTVTHTDDTAVLAAHNNHIEAFLLQDYRKVSIRHGLKNGKSKLTEQNQYR